MKISVEFFGIPRQRAGVDRVVLDHLAEPSRLADVLRALATRSPPFAAECLDGDRLRSAYLANVGGDRFLSDPNAVLRDGDVLLIMSADAGG